MANICIVTPGSLGSNPRVVKEADALAAAGHNVHVIATRVLDQIDARDAEILAGAAWSAERVDLRGAMPRKAYRLLQMIARPWHAVTGLGAAHAYSLFHSALAQALRHRTADLYIAHYDAALSAVGEAARRAGTRYAFDAEDFHPGDLPQTPQHARDNRLITAIEARWLPGCAYTTAASPGIAEAYARTYSITAPQVVLNVFPRDQAPGVATPTGTAGPSLYWFSQTIGPDRGLECAVRAIALSERRPDLYLRGILAAGYGETLKSLAAEYGVSGQLHILAPEPASEMARLAATYDLGLVAETGNTPNHQIALSNKQFTYLLAGVPVLMSDTPGHRAFAAEIPGAARLFPVDDATALAEAIDGLLADPAALARARATAFTFGQTRFNWDTEQTLLTSLVTRVLA